MFFISLLVDLQMLVAPWLARFRIRDPHGWSAVAFSLELIFEIAVLAGATLLWFLMLHHCWIAPGNSIVWRLLWTSVFFFGAWFSSQVYYLFSFRRGDLAGEPAW